MQGKIQQCIQVVTEHKVIILGVTALLVVGGVTVYAMTNSPSSDDGGAVSVQAEIIETAIAGEPAALGTSDAGSSWPGELVSLGSVPVQPARDGSIASWGVHVGERVYAGQVLGTLSGSPSMPDTIAMVAEKAGEVAMSQTSVTAKRTYVAGRIVELRALRTNTEESLQASQSLLGTDGSSNSTLPMIAAKKELVRAILRGTLANTYPQMSGSATVPALWSEIRLISPIGAQDSRLRDQFPDVVFEAKKDLDTPDKSPATSGLAYYSLTIKLADASLPDGAMLTPESLAELKAMLHADQQAFIMAIDEVKKTELMAVETNKTAFAELRAIDNEIATLTAELAMLEGEVVAKEAAYQAVRSGVQGQTAILAPIRGTVSSITKRVGEFVGPGMPVAVITSETASDYVVRFRIPSNVRMPLVGQEFFVSRSGYSTQMSKAKLIGVGNSLDETGSIMADAVLLEPVDWPVGVSLRVLAGADVGAIEIALASVWWDATGAPNVWVVSAGQRVFAKEVVLGRTLGEKVEIYSGLIRGERYVVTPTSNIVEDMIISDIAPLQQKETSGSSYEEAMRAMGHEM